VVRPRGQRVLSATLDPLGAKAIGSRFQLAVARLTAGALLGLLIPFLGAAVIAILTQTGARLAARRDPAKGPVRGGVRQA
jgi:hypothetical protein